MRYNILVVDDEEVNLFLYKRILKDYNLYIAENKKQMLKILETATPDLILLDVMLPDGDGFEIARQLTYTKDNCDIPIIFVTAKAQTNDIIFGLNIGAYDYITKPFDAKILTARIEKAITLKKKELELFKLATTDSLTRLFNKRYFNIRGDEHLTHTQRTNKNFSVAILDIDLFKNINDTFGHMIGDKVIERFSFVLSKEVRPYDLVARFGGEEFTILFVDCDKKTAKDVVERIKNKVKSEVKYPDKSDTSITFSAGISEFEEVKQKETVSLSELLVIADKRLYSAKDNGRDKVIID